MCVHDAAAIMSLECSPRRPARLLAGPVAPGTLVHGRYTVREVLGRGANAITYSATDSTNGKQVRSVLLCCSTVPCRSTARQP